VIPKKFFFLIFIKIFLLVYLKNKLHLSAFFFLMLQNYDWKRIRFV
jgi:hypothetical protein